MARHRPLDVRAGSFTHHVQCVETFVAALVLFDDKLRDLELLGAFFVHHWRQQLEGAQQWVHDHGDRLARPVHVPELLAREAHVLPAVEHEEAFLARDDGVHVVGEEIHQRDRHPLPHPRGCPNAVESGHPAIRQKTPVDAVKHHGEEIVVEVVHELWRPVDWRRPCPLNILFWSV